MVIHTKTLNLNVFNKTFSQCKIMNFVTLFLFFKVCLSIHKNQILEKQYLFYPVQDKKKKKKHVIIKEY